MLNNWKVSLVFLFVSGLVLLFIVAPLAGMFLQTTGAQYAATVADEEVMRSIRLTLVSSLVGVIIFGILAIPLAYVLARRNFREKVW